jgi:hypothetical protein
MHGITFEENNSEQKYLVKVQLTDTVGVCNAALILSALFIKLLACPVDSPRT